MFENDLHARHSWLLTRRDTLRASLEGNPDWCDPQVAGWWAWCIACWIGGGFCSGNGPWVVNEARQLVHLGDAGQGVKRQLVHLGNAGRGAEPQAGLVRWFSALAERLAGVRVCSGDWTRVCGPSVTFVHGPTAVFLDPPYADTANREPGIYREDSESVAHAVRAWAIENGANPLMRIALCGYEGEHEMPDNWAVHAWNAGAGYGAQKKQADDDETPLGQGRRERIWYSPHCLGPAQASLFGGAVLGETNDGV